MSFSYQTEIKTDLVFNLANQSPNTTGGINIVFGDPNATQTFSYDFDVLMNSVKAMKYVRKNETLLINVVRNFIRKTNFSELNETLDAGHINIEEYNAELEKNSDKYAISLESLNSQEDIFNIVELANKISINLRDLSTSEVSEMFSVREDELIKSINNCFHPIK